MAKKIVISEGCNAVSLH